MTVEDVLEQEGGSVPRKIRHLSDAERAAKGKQAREKAPRSAHARFEARPGRPDPVSLLESQAATRVPELVPIRYGRMLVSPFTFYRGAALIMASDLSATPHSGLTAQICGDAHLSNFGVFGSPERRLVFDCNDFDETLPGPWEWDVKRLAASVVIAGRELGFSKGTRAEAVTAIGKVYRVALRELATMTNLEVWYSRMEIEDVVDVLKTQAATTGSKVEGSMATRASRVVAKARTKDSMKAVAKLTTLKNGVRRIVSDPPLIVPAEDLFPEMQMATMMEIFHELLRRYRASLPTDRRHLLEQYKLVQLARKVVGVGSVGTRCWIMLMLGRDSEDPLFLQIKEAGPSVLSEYAGDSHYEKQGQRVVEGQRLMQAASDVFLGWHRMNPAPDGVVRDFYIRQLRDWKFSLDTQAMKPSGLSDYGQVCGWTLARAHARSGDRIAIAGYLGTSDTFDRAVAEFAAAYADQNERDYADLKEAATSGRVLAQRGV